MRKLVLLMAMLGGCARPPDPRNEHAAWDRLLRTMRELHALEHACDAERSVCNVTHGDATAAMLTTSRGGAANAALRIDKERVAAAVVACEERQPDYVESENDKARPAATSDATRRARDDRRSRAISAWLDACSKCAHRRECMQRIREVMELGAGIATYGAPPVCKPGEPD